MGGVRHPLPDNLIAHDTDHQVCSTGQRPGSRSMHRNHLDGFRHGVRLVQLEPSHSVLPSAAMMRVRDSGRSVSQTPTALWNAFARTGPTGGVEACPMATAP